jgi:hypothetical protein
MADWKIRASVLGMTQRWLDLAEAATTSTRHDYRVMLPHGVRDVWFLSACDAIDELNSDGVIRTPEYAAFTDASVFPE